MSVYCDREFPLAALRMMKQVGVDPTEFGLHDDGADSAGRSIQISTAERQFPGLGETHHASGCPEDVCIVEESIDSLSEVALNSLYKVAVDASNSSFDAQ